MRWLDKDDPFPSVEQALEEPNGLLAVSQDITLARLEQAYRLGIFPWYSQGQPVLWWSPNPRMVLECDALHVSHSLGKTIRQIQAAHQQGDFSKWVVTVDCALTQVIQACAERVSGDSTQPPDTWITPHMMQAYCDWHQHGRVHSVETWLNGQLVGGLYGVSIGRCFFGESMFRRANDASKIALYHLILFLKRHNVTFLDCQMFTNHLASLGAHLIDRSEFLQRVTQAIAQPELPWQMGWIRQDGDICPGFHPPAHTPPNFLPIPRVNSLS